MLIGLTGRTGSGKETAAAYLAEAHRFLPLDFATPLRQMLQAGLGLTDAHFTPAAEHNAIDWIGRSPHQLMQSLGTEWGRSHVKASLWTDLAARELDSLAGLDVVFLDVDGEDEAAMIRDRGGYLIHLVRPDAASPHARIPGAGVQLREGDQEIHNDGSLFQLYDQLDRIVGDKAFAGGGL
ncbi:hypothetical protein [Cupriavidus malaysiensis]|uniref:Deoxynucleotide monophosphate kinase n=1 Tax=Cupriavidus malaysiensis TaxID=367825 RepID=A0ABN4TGJ0_9BURK|nr:hypothetical protein [Cupriavidus malaysiensis]AOZ05943.1 hypothetical protein BKK80_08975 [Cupriavidus malaysiensis]